MPIPRDIDQSVLIIWEAQDIAVTLKSDLNLTREIDEAIASELAGRAHNRVYTEVAKVTQDKHRCTAIRNVCGLDAFIVVVTIKDKN